MTDICKSIGDLTEQLQDTADLQFEDQLVSDIQILNKNTEVLNIELDKIRISTNNLLQNAPFFAKAKQDFKITYVPTKLLKQYESAKLVFVSDLIEFVERNKVDFLTVKNKNDLLVKLQVLDPENLRGFYSEFPNIENRIQLSPITNAETNKLILENNLDSNLFAIQAQSNPRGLLRLLERLLSGLSTGISIMGSFCSIVDNVFSLVDGKKDIFANQTSFVQDFSSITNAISPRLGDITQQIQKLTELISIAQSDSSDAKSKLQASFSIMASAFGIVLKFFDPNTQEEPSIDFEWDLEKLKDNLLSDNLFQIILESTNKKLGDIDQNGILDSDDVDSLQTYIDETSTDTITRYIEEILLSYMKDNKEVFAAYVLVPDSGEVSPELLSEFSSVVSLFGSSSSPTSGDFGLSSINQMLSQLTSLGSLIESISSSSRPTNITSILQQINTIRSLSGAALQVMQGDFALLTTEYKKTVDESLKEAEKLSVNNPTKTRQVSENNEEALSEQYSVALSLVGKTDATLGRKLNIELDALGYKIGDLAAVGVLEETNLKLSNVVETSAKQLESKLSFFSPNSLNNNGFHFNMIPVFSKFAALVSTAKSATERESVERTKDIVKGSIAVSSDFFREKKKEEVEFVALRFCELAAEIEKTYASLTTPIEQMILNHNSVNNRLISSGSDVTRRAVAAGAIRLDSSVRVQSSLGILNTPATISRQHADTSTGRSTIIPADTTDVQTGYGGGTIPPSLYSDLPRFQDVNGKVWNGLFSYALGGRTSGALSRAGLSPSDGWDGLLQREHGIETIRRLIAAVEEYKRRGGTSVRINSAFRPGDTGQHGQRRAFDVSIPNRNNQLLFANIAYNAGFRGIGSYGTFIHVDTGSQRSWSGTGAYFDYYQNRLGNLRGPLGNRTYT